jgi:hypothetical protein
MNLFDFEQYVQSLLKENFFTKDIPYGNQIYKNQKLDKLPSEKIYNNKQIFTYNFDNYGYRYDETPYDLTKNKKIFCFGCSETFGHGVQYKETWPFLLNNYFNNYNIYNYGVEGSSNNSIFRRIYQLLKYLEINNMSYPEYIFIYFTSFDRDELVCIKNKNIKILNLGRWSGKKFENFIKSKDSLHSMFEFIRNFKFIEEMCAGKNIKMYWSSWSPQFKILSKKILTNYLNCNTLLHNNYLHICPRLDYSRDKTHVGKKTNVIRAKNFYEMVLQNS